MITSDLLQQHKFTYINASIINILQYTNSLDRKIQLFCSILFNTYNKSIYSCTVLTYITIFIYINILIYYVKAVNVNKMLKYI